MPNKLYAVIDTNVIVSAFLSKTLGASPAMLFRAITKGIIIPLFNEEILTEYREVLSREKFHFSMDLIDAILQTIVTDGIDSERISTKNDVFPDPKDIVFYEIALSHKGAYLVTGNTKHFPKSPIVVTPAEMLQIIQKQYPSFLNSTIL